MIKFLFISAIDPYAEVQYRFPQLGLGYLASSLRQHFGPNAFKFKVVFRNVETEINDFKPDVIGITAASQNYNYAKHYAKLAKSKNIPVIMGGIHVSCLPTTLTEDMDVAVLGEGERTICELMEGFAIYGFFHTQKLHAIDGIAYRENGNLNVTPTRKFIEPLDSIPFPARELLNTSAFGNIFSSRGCPYRCLFCASTRYWNKLRFFSAEYVVAELVEMVEKYGAKRISFYDDLMIADKQRFERIAELIRNAPALVKTKFGINARANLITDHTAQVLKAMHVNSVGMGLESGNERTLRYLKGGSVSVEDNYNAVKILQRYGISANASFVIGSPDETREEILDTLHFIKTSGLNFVDTFVLVPFPGTPVWDYAKSIGAVSDDMNWDRLNIYHPTHGYPISLSKHVGPAEMNELCKKFYHARLRIAARSAWTHPFFPAMVRAGMANVANRVRRLGAAHAI